MPINDARRPAGNGAASTPPRSHHYIAGLRRRRAAARRLPRLDCCTTSDPWTHRHPDGPVTEKTVDGYRAAAEHLLEHGFTPAPNIPAMRVMFKRGGVDRQLVNQLTDLWPVVA